MTIDVDIPGGTLQLTVSSATSVGEVRRVNEDSLVAVFPVYAVADGMGGHARGDRASQEIVRMLSELGGDGASLSPEQVLDAIRASNDSVRALAAADGPDVLSGSTLTGVAFVTTTHGDGAYWMAYNIGDSRVYEWDGRRLRQLSVDHSVVQELVDGGFITDAEARRHPDRNVVTRAVGGSADVDADVWMLPAAHSRSFLICSDGLTKELDDDEIARILAGHDDADGASVAEALVRAANDAGGSDNISVIALDSRNAAVVESETRDGVDENTLDRFEDTRPRV